MEEQIKNLKVELCEIMIQERNCQAQLNALIEMDQRIMMELQKLLQEQEKKKSEVKTEVSENAKVD